MTTLGSRLAFVGHRWNPDRWVVVAATLIAALLVSVELQRPSYWIDEKISVDIASPASPLQVVANVVEGERRPPGYALSLWAWTQLTGGSERLARLHSGLWVILLVPATFQLALRLAGRRAALCAVAVTAAAPILISYGQTVRYYTMVAALSALSYALFLDLMRRPPGRRPWLLHFAVTLGLLYCDYPAYGVVLAQNVVALLWWRNRETAPHHPRWTWLAEQLVLGGATLLWLPIVLQQGSRDLGAADLSGSLAGTALKVIYPFYAWLVGENLFPWSPAAVAGALAAGAALIYGFVKLNRRGSRVFWLAGFIAPFVVSQLLLGTVATDSPFVNAPARAMACAPLLYCLVGNGLACVPRRGLRAVLIGAMLVSFAFGLSNYYQRTDFINSVYNTPARDVAQAIAAQAQPGDLVVSEPDSLVSAYLPPELQAAHFLPNQTGDIAAYLSQHPGAGAWQVIMGRDRTRNDISEKLAAWLKTRYPLRASAGFAEQNPAYRAVKSRLLGREAYRYRLTLDEYRR